MTRTSPDAFRVKTSGLVVAVAIAVLLWFELAQMLVDRTTCVDVISILSPKITLAFLAKLQFDNT